MNHGQYPEALVLQSIYNAETKTTLDFQVMSVTPISSLICVFGEKKAGEVNTVSFFTFGFLSFSAMYPTPMLRVV